VTLPAGTKLGPYEVVAPLGAGGMGEVYRARDTRLDREVAVKVLPGHLSDDPELKLRFEREARAISQLTHPHICTLYDVGSAGGVDFLVMELLDGKSLADRLDAGALPVDETLAFGRQIAEALDRAHRAGVIHRDLKPGNVMLTAAGVKLLDFGLAKTSAPEEPPPADLSRLPTEAVSASRNLTQRGAVMGTLTYMSPEQLLGKPVDARSDLFSLGTVLYEMVTGRRPFRGSSTVAIADAILHDPPQNFGDAAAPERLKTAILRLLQKDPARRFSSAAELSAELGALEASRGRSGPSRGTLALVAAGVVAAAALAGWLWRRESRIRWARGTATLEATRLIAAEDFPKAARLIREARAILPNDPTLQGLWTQATVEVSAETVPPGADVSYRPYRGDPGKWTNLGKTPFAKVRVAKNFYLWKIEKPGFEPAWQIAPTWSIVHNIPARLKFRLDPVGSAPAGMVRVPGGKDGLEIPGFDQYPAIEIDDFLIDRHEVTNEEYKRFVDAGGYRRAISGSSRSSATERPSPGKRLSPPSATRPGSRGRRRGRGGAFRKGRRNTRSRA